MDLQSVLSQAESATDPIQVLIDADWDRWIGFIKPCGHPMAIAQCGNAVVMFADDIPAVEINQFDGEESAVNAWRHGVATILAAQMAGQVTDVSVGGTVDMTDEPTVPFSLPYVV